MKLIENDMMRVWLNKTDARLHTEWLRTVTQEEFREGVLLFSKLILEEGIEEWIVDSSKLHGIMLSDQQWMLNHILPALQHSKLRKMARIGQGDIFHYITFEQLHEKAMQKFDIPYEVAQFTSLAMAESWLNMKE